MAGRLTPDGRHQPVLVERVTELLITDTRGAYLDLTAGGGGHMRALAERLDKDARLYGTDVDSEAVERTKQALAGLVQKTTVLQTAFADIGEAVSDLPEQTFDGILLDLGISSDQLDSAERGISFRLDGPLDMRLNRDSGGTAAELLNSCEEHRLREILTEFGEERRAAGIAAAIVRERQRGMILTTTQLRDIVLSVSRPPHQNKTLARVFQALRIAVNREMDQLSRVLPVALSLLNPGGRLAVIAYHSLEDRQVKRFYQQQASGICTCPPGLPDCVCGATPSLTLITRKPVKPTEAEITQNPRSRSARLRVAEKVT
jgi:16S rRNA (cytosine1402-N4)-methyltransferase